MNYLTQLTCKVSSIQFPLGVWGIIQFHLLDRGSAVSHSTCVKALLLVLAEAVATDVKLEEVEPVTAKEPTVKPIALTSKDSIGDDPSCSPSPVKVKSLF